MTVSDLDKKQHTEFIWRRVGGVEVKRRHDVETRGSREVVTVTCVPSHVTSLYYERLPVCPSNPTVVPYSAPAKRALVQPPFLIPRYHTYQTFWWTRGMDETGVCAKGLDVSTFCSGSVHLYEAAECAKKLLWGRRG